MIFDEDVSNVNFVYALFPNYADEKLYLPVSEVKAIVVKGKDGKINHEPFEIAKFYSYGKNQMYKVKTAVGSDRSHPYYGYIGQIGESVELMKKQKLNPGFPVQTERIPDPCSTDDEINQQRPSETANALINSSKQNAKMSQKQKQNCNNLNLENLNKTAYFNLTSSSDPRPSHDSSFHLAEIERLKAEFDAERKQYEAKLQSERERLNAELAKAKLEKQQAVEEANRLKLSNSQMPSDAKALEEFVDNRLLSHLDKITGILKSIETNCGSSSKSPHSKLYVQEWLERIPY